MKHKFFTIPIIDAEASEAALNQFCDKHRIADVEKHYDAGKSAWAVCVTWLSQEGSLTSGNPVSTNKRRPKVDYKEILSAEVFEQFSALRKLRKSLSEQEGVALYNIFTNDQLVAIVQQKIATKADLLRLEGVGQTRAEKYSEPFFKLVKQFDSNET